MARNGIPALVLAALLLPAALAAADPKPAKPARSLPDDPKVRLGYALGLDVGERLKEIRKEFDLKAFEQGMEDLLKEAEPALTPQEAAKVRQEFVQRYQAQKAEERAKMGEKNKKEGEAFLAANKSKPGVVTTASGLQYQILKEGKGPSPGPRDRVTVHYKGTLLDGTVFDSSFDRGQPATFPLTGVIKGWSEGLSHFKEGGSGRLFIPPDLAYGERGAGDKIGPNAVLVFDVDLLKVEPQPEPTPPPAPGKAK